MLKITKQKLQQQYNEMWKTDWKEIIGSITVCIGFILLTFLWFSIAI
jgi:hypothetical protein